MPFPFISVLAGLESAIAAGFSGRSNLKKAEEIDAKARDKYKEIQYSLNNTRNKTNSSLENLGRKKLNLYTDGSAARFLKTAAKIRNIPLIELDEELEKARSAIHQEFAGGMPVSDGSGALTALTTPGATKGKTILEQAEENQSRVEAFEKDAKAICDKLNNIWKASERMISVLGRMDDLLGKYVCRLEAVAAANDTYLTYSEEEKKLTKNCFFLYAHMKHLLETKLMDQDCTLISGCLETIEEQEKFIDVMNDL